MRYRLRTLLILLAILPPLLWLGWGKYQAWKAEQERLKTLDQDTIELILETPIFTRYGAPEQPRDGAQSAP